MSLGGADHHGRTRNSRSRRAIAEVAAARASPYAGGGRRSQLLRRQIVECREERALLEARVAELERESRRLYASYVEAEARSTHFAHLFVTVQRLRAARGRDAIHAVIRELVESILGSSEVALYELDEGGARLLLGTAWGIDCAPRALPLAGSVIGQVAATGRPYFRGDDAEEGKGPELTACVPLAAEGQRIGALAIFRLLPQKPSLSAADHEILEVLAANAAAALRDSACPAVDPPLGAACEPSRTPRP